ncbi:Long-chain-fatty-acid--CoA ligase 5 [Podochytrium sp. JEL0797]|nr:Long-chain-fatty-acid--CoA ligase 5 [Podochytrium sp. JEL0797]
MQAKEELNTRPSDGSETGIFKSLLPTSDLHKEKKHLKTLIDGFQDSAKKYPNRPMLGHRPKTIDSSTGKVTWGDYQWQSYRRVSERRINLGSGIVGIHQSLCGGALGDKFNVAIYSLNRPAWTIADLANMSYGLVTVPLYDTLGPAASQYILNHATPPIVICSFDKVEPLVSEIQKCPSVKAIISMDEVNLSNKQTFEILRKWAKEKGVVLYSFAEVEARGAKNRFPFSPGSPDDLCCISYTSGTTGDPKGAMLSNRNLVSFILHAADSGQDFNETDVYISYLPAAHVYEKVMIASVVGVGGSIGYFRGDVALLIEDIATLKPTIFASVPRLLNRIHDKIVAQANSSTALKALLFKTAVEAKLANYKTTGILTHSIWDPLVFNKVRAALGGRVRFISSSSAPIHPSVLQFLSIAFGCQVREGYGQTETSGGVTIGVQGDRDTGHVGPVITGCEMKLVSVPDMNYFAKNNQGEVWVRGPTIFKGYFKDEVKTLETITPDGWLKTGDIGKIDAKGRLSVIDRKKNIFKLSQGEYVAPEKIENVCIKASPIAQMFVHGESLRNELVGIAVLDPETCIPTARKMGVLPATTPDSGIVLPGAPPNPHVQALAKNPEFRKYVMEELQKVCVAANLAGFEHVKAVYLESDAFGIENELLTPTMKLKRNDLVKKYKTQIAELYREIEAGAKPVAAKL